MSFHRHHGDVSSSKDWVTAIAMALGLVWRLSAELHEQLGDVVLDWTIGSGQENASK